MKSVDFLPLWKVSFYYVRDNVEFWSKAINRVQILLDLVVT